MFTKQLRAGRVLLFTLLIVLMVCVSGCSKEDSQASGSGKDPVHSETLDGDNTQTADKEGEGKENHEEPAPVKTLDFSRLNGVGNNPSNLSTCNDSFAQGFVSDGTYIYFNHRSEKNGLWRMKLDGSECELYVPEMSGIIEQFNLLDGELYYIQKTVIYAVNLNTREIRTVAYASASAIDQLLVIGDRVYWVESDGAVMTTMRDGSSRPYYCRRGGNNPSGGVCELTTDGEKLYLLVSEKLNNVETVCLSVYELNLSVPCEDAEDVMARMAFAATSDMSGVFYPVNGNFFTIGTNGFLLAKRYDEGDGKTWKYESVFFDDIDGSLRTTAMNVEGTFGMAKEDGAFYWRDMSMPKFVLGDTLFGVYNSKYQEGITNTVVAPHYIYMMPDMDVGTPTLVYTYSGEDFVAGGVYGDRLYVIEEAGDVMKLTTIDRDGKVI